MKENIKQLMVDRFNELPKTLQNAILANDLPRKIDDIAKKYRLHIDQAGDFETETMLVMLGLEPAANFVSNLQTSMSLDSATAAKITDDANEQIFSPIKHLLMETDKGREEEEREFSPQTIAETPITLKSMPLIGVNGGEEEGLHELKKEDVLREIEQPAKSSDLTKKVEVVVPAASLRLSNFNQSVGGQITATPSIKTDTEKINFPAVNTPIIPSPKLPESIVEKKLSGMVVSPKQNIEIGPEAPIEKKSYPMDPYREEAK